MSDDMRGFPAWRNLSHYNVERIKERIDAPLKGLLWSAQTDCWLDSWGKRPQTAEEITARIKEASCGAPRLIPIYSHRYMPMLEGAENPPVISTVGFDIIYYGSELKNYLRNEFIDKEEFPKSKCMYIPFWSDIIEG